MTLNAFQERRLIFFDTPSCPQKNSFGRVYSKNRSFFRMKLRYITETGVAMFFEKFELIS